MSGILNMGGAGTENKIQHLAACTANTDGANKKYVDDRAWASTGSNVVWSTPPHFTEVVLPSATWTEITRVTVDYVNTTTDILLVFNANVYKAAAGNGANALQAVLRWVHNPDATAPTEIDGLSVVDFEFLTSVYHPGCVYACMNGRTLTGGGSLTGSQTWAVEMRVIVSSGTGTTANVYQHMITAFVK